MMITNPHRSRKKGDGFQLRRLSTSPTRTTLAEQAIREHITDGHLRPGEIYSVADLASELGVSRTPVREALIGLASRGLVRFERNRGVRVLKPTVQDVEDAYEFRLVLETHAIRRIIGNGDSSAVRRLRAIYETMLKAAIADDDAGFHARDRVFHLTLALATGNSRFVDAMDRIFDHLLTYKILTAGRGQPFTAVATQHTPLLEALEQGDEEGAVEALSAMLARTRADLRQRLSASGVETPSDEAVETRG